MVEIDRPRDLGYTVCCGLQTILSENENVEQVYINYGDMLISGPFDSGRRDVIYYADEAISPEWTFFKQDDGVIYEILDKHRPSRWEERTGNVFPGVFGIAHPEAFWKELRAAQSDPSPEMDTFYQALSQYSARYPFAFEAVEEWLDIGHRDRFAQARAIVASRMFNSIEIDKLRGCLTKRSRNREKLIDEIQWYLNIPAQLRYLTPRLYSYSLARDDVYMTMEYYGYSTLHELFVYGEISEGRWREIFQRILFVLNDMRCFRPDSGAENRKKALESVYITKTVSRLESLRDSDDFRRFFEEPIIVNDKTYPALGEYVTRLPEVIRHRLTDDPPPFCVIHGDLCFSNIMVEHDLGFLRVIDPRGRFGDYDIYGDQRYEIAKLMHSIDGQYDFIIEDMFSVAVNGNQITYEPVEKGKDIFLVFQNVFNEHLSDIKDLKLLEGLLFLSMLPLHGDHIDRQYAMLATGLRLLEEADWREAL